MSKTEELRTMIGAMLMVPPDEIGPETSLGSLTTSLGSARIRLGLKRLGLQLPGGPAPTNFAALVAAVSGETMSAPGPVSRPQPACVPVSGNVPAGGFLPGLHVGLDAEAVGSLPAALDYWEHEFYRDTFASSEIAYAVLKTEPRTHFAGFWCAKEALRKCDPAFTTTDMNRVAVFHGPDGRPYLTVQTETGAERLSHSLSISHTSDLAVAMVVMPPVAASPVQTEGPATPPPSASAPALNTRKPRGLKRLLSAMSVLFVVPGV
jgi:phosphopantetheine--protein transferase-like protein